jgi:hypothetical protein
MSYELVRSAPTLSGIVPRFEKLTKRHGASWGTPKRGTAVMPVGGGRLLRRSAAMFYSGVRPDPSEAWRPVFHTSSPGWVPPNVPLSGLAFSLKPPKWVRKLPLPAKIILGGVAAVGAMIAAPAAAGLLVRGGTAVAKTAIAAGKVGAAAFRVTAGKPGTNLVSSLFARAKAKGPSQPTVTVTQGPIETPGIDMGPIVTRTEPPPSPPPIVMTSGGPMLPQPSYADLTAPPAAARGGAESEATPTAAGINPALLLGGLAVGALLLSRRGGR